MRHLAHTDPDEYEKLNRLLCMSSTECDEWLAAADMPFTTTSKEARVAGKYEQAFPRRVRVFSRC